MEKIELLPFLKWAGGKRWFVSQFDNEIPKKFNRYIEPFLGSGAVYFHLQPKMAILSDINESLIATYQAIKDFPLEVEQALQKHHRNHSTEYYYEVRNSSPRTAHTKAAKFIYLNRTCWNGLYRVNLSGEFNVPIGTKKYAILSTDDFTRSSKMLKKADLRNCDFESVIDEAIDGDLVFVDPPYTVNHNHNGFIKYNEKMFSWTDQIRLRDSLIRAQLRGVSIVATNAAHPSVIELYKDRFDVATLKRSSVISGNSSGRGTFDELFIKG